MRFDTELGYHPQVDFSEFQVAGADGSVTKLFFYPMMLNRPTTFKIGKPFSGH
jgi:hypothetical protein